MDTHIKVHDMTETEQNIDTHDCAVAFVPNRVNNNALGMERPRQCLVDFDNANFLCSEEDHQLQRENYIVLVERIIASDIKCLHSLQDVVTKHIIHLHSREMTKKCHMVCFNQFIVKT